MSSDTSDTSDICPRTLAGHWPDTLGHTGHTFGQTRCAGGVQVSQGVSGHSRTLSDTTILPLSAHYSLFFMVSPTILLSFLLRVQVRPMLVCFLIELLEVNLGDQLDVRRPGKDIAWRRENSYCKIENIDEGMAKKSRRPIF